VSPGGRPVPPEWQEHAEAVADGADLGVRAVMRTPRHDGGCSSRVYSPYAAWLLSRDRVVAVHPGAWSECEPARVGEAETGVAGGAFGEHGGEDASPFIEVVVDFGRGLVLMRAQDPAHLVVSSKNCRNRGMSQVEARIRCFS
jgi:hypothetical protein